jgi:hypothetical protein
MSLLKTPIQTRAFTTASYGIWDRIAIDTIGPLPESSEGHKYILVFIDTFSRFIELVPIKNLTAETAADALIQLLGRYGIPAEILTDNGTQFANQIFDQLPKMLELTHRRTQAYSHEENSIVERANKEIMRHLRDIIFDTRIIADWHKYVPFVMRIKNSEVHSATGVTPASIIFGRNVDLNRGILTPYKLPEQKLSEYIGNNLIYQNMAIKIALETQYKTDLYHIKQSIEKKRKQTETQFEINSYVLVKYENRDGLKPHAPPTKLHPKLRGPFQVISKTQRKRQGTIYTCKNLITNKLEDFHVTNLQPFTFEETYTNPIEAALADNESFFVEEILNHRFTDNKHKIKSNLQFLIKWKGLDKPSWEPWKNTSKLEKVHQYMKATKQLMMLLPKNLR